MSENGYLEVAGARVLCPASGLDEVRDFWIVDGLLSFDRPSGRGGTRIDAEGLVAAPAFVEIHAHLREPGFSESETVQTGLAAALAGGYAAVFAMANTKPVNDRPEITKQILRAAEACGSPVRLHPVTAATIGFGGRELADYEAQKRAGAGAVSDDGVPVLDDEVMAKSMVAAARAGLPVMSHATHHPAPGGGVVHDGERARELGVPGLAREEEDALVARDVRLARETGCPVHICHVSTAGAVAVLRKARAEGVPVTAEAAPHHLLLTDRDVHGPDEKMNPPLRTAEDREAVVGALAEGVLSAVATDHAPHAAEKKARGLRDAPFGVIGMESAFPACYTGLVVGGAMPLVELIRRFTEGPAAVGRVPGGRLRAGERAEVVLLDLETPFVLGPERLRSKSRNCPFLGRELRGRIVATILGRGLHPVDSERFRSANL
jgi:dihydroorotase